MNQYLEVIREKGSTHCIDADREGNYRISSARECTIETNYDKIVKSILATKSDRFEDYAVELHENVCQNCSYGTPDICDNRNQVECPLDRYYPMIIDAIEDIGIQHIRVANSIS